MFLEMSVDFQWNTQHYISEHISLYNSHVTIAEFYISLLSTYISITRFLAEHWVFFLSHHVLGSPSLSQIMVAGALSWQLTSCVPVCICQTRCCSKLLDYTSTLNSTTCLYDGEL
jgi:hypothetical protein